MSKPEPEPFVEPVLELEHLTRRFGDVFCAGFAAEPEADFPVAPEADLRGARDFADELRGARGARGAVPLGTPSTRGDTASRMGSSGPPTLGSSLIRDTLPNARGTRPIAIG